jgi:hypothetical protein
MEALLLFSTNFIAFLTKKKRGEGADFCKKISTVHSTNFWGNICQTFAITKLKKRTLHGRHSTN